MSTSVSERLPMPDWTRPGESWRVEAEDAWTLTDEFICGHRSGKGADLTACYRRSVAARRNFALCAVHLREGRMWIEDGQVVSWAQRP